MFDPSRLPSVKGVKVFPSAPPVANVTALKAKIMISSRNRMTVNTFAERSILKYPSTPTTEIMPRAKIQLDTEPIPNVCSKNRLIV